MDGTPRDLTADPQAIATAAPMTQAPAPAWSALDLAIALGMLTLVGVLGYGLWSQHQRLGALEAALTERPAIRVADYSAVSAAVGAGHSAEAVLPLFQSIKRGATAHGARGVLVLNRAALESAPEALLIGPDEEALAAHEFHVSTAPLTPAGSGAGPAPRPGQSRAPGLGQSNTPGHAVTIPQAPMTPAEAAALLQAFTAQVGP